MITNGLVRATASMARHLDMATSAPELAALKGQQVTVDHLGTELTGRCTRVGYSAQGSKLVDYWLDLLTSTGEVRLRSADVRVLAAGPVALPTCTAFAGTGQRCTACRVRKAMHN